MISCKLQGGLGNQLFQIATTISLSEENNVACAFNFNAPCINQGHSPMKYRDTIYADLDELPRFWIPKSIYKEPHFHYEPIPFSDNMLLVGYFQSERYFANQRYKLYTMVMRGVKPLGHKYYDILKDSCSIHVRRGDYIKFSGFHRLLPLEYYREAISIARDKGARELLVFSDDIEWCKTQLKFGGMYFMNLNEYDSLRLMALCEHHIIANSSFSWWGAYLGGNSGITIAPAEWFGPGCNHETKDLIPKEWIKI